MGLLLLTFFMLTIGFGTALVWCGSHWFFVWLGLEINTVAIVPILAQYQHPRMTEAALKYFIVQATGAMIMTFAGTTNALLTGTWGAGEMLHPIPAAMMITALTLKMGLAPLHFWLPEVMQGLDMPTMVVVATWQKLAPFIILVRTAYTLDPDMLLFIGVLSILVGAWGAMNQTQIRKILAYSSIAHMGWIIAVVYINSQLATFALCMYFLMVSATLITLKRSAAMAMTTMGRTWSKSPSVATMTLLLILSLMGLPPLSGFAAKLLILKQFADQSNYATAAIIILTTLISLFFYLRMCYIMAVLLLPHANTSMMSWRTIASRSSLPSAMLSTLAILLIPLLSTIMALIKLLSTPPML